MRTQEFLKEHLPPWDSGNSMDVARRIRFSSDADNVRLTNVCIIIIIIITQFVNEL